MKKFFVIIIAAMTMSANAMAQNVNDVTVANKGSHADVSYSDGSKTAFDKRNSSSLSFQENLSIYKGERRAYNTKHTGLDGKDLLKTTFFAQGGVALVERTAIPQITAGVSHAFWKNLDLELQAEFSKGKYDEEAIASGWYKNLGLYAGANLTVLQSDSERYAGTPKKGFKITIGGMVGYTYHETDDLSVEKINGSSGYSITGKANARAQVNLGGGFALRLELGVRALPGFSLDKSKSGEEEFFGKIAPYAQGGVAFSF